MQNIWPFLSDHTIFKCMDCQKKIFDLNNGIDFRIDTVELRANLIEFTSGLELYERTRTPARHLAEREGGSVGEGHLEDWKAGFGIKWEMGGAVGKEFWMWEILVEREVGN
jgi:hypothetical protein